MKKTLLITTDDFGMCHSVNTGIVAAMTKGFCSSTNFIVPAPWFHEAVALAKEARLDVGVHLCLGSDWDRLRWAPLTANPRLRADDGRLPARPEQLEALGASDDDLYDELKAQIMLAKRLYGQPSHLDTHMLGGYLTPGFASRIQGVIRRLSGEFRLAYTYERVPENGRLRHFAAELCMTTMDATAFFTAVALWQAPGQYHLISHAATASEELDAICSVGHTARVWAADARVQDLAWLMDPDFRSRLEAMGFDLVPSTGARDYLAALTEPAAKP